jgi:predicted dehydrogenase
MRVAIIGCGVIGRRRCGVVRASAQDEVVVVADVKGDRAEEAGRDAECAWTTNWADVVDREDVDAIVVATTNKWLAPVSLAALERGKHVLCEKPAGQTPGEVQDLKEAAETRGLTFKVGFNLRHAPALVRAHSLCADGAIGDVTFLRARYGHGGRPGMESEWRCDATISGGGELLDQGVHVIDLCRWFAGDFGEVFAYTANYCWPAPPGTAGVEDNAFVLLRAATGTVASLHVSWTQWKNVFSFEVFGTAGYAVVEGLGGSYGPSTLRLGRRAGAGGAPDESCEHFDGSESSWVPEWEEFTSAIAEDRQPLGNGLDALRVAEMVQAAYESARQGGPVVLPEVRGPACVR